MPGNTTEYNEVVVSVVRAQIEASTPPTDTNGACFYSKDVGGICHLFVQTSDGSEFQLTPWYHGRKFSAKSKDLFFPNSADWAVNGHAPIDQDDNNSGFSVRYFDDTAETGIGWEDVIPVGATKIKLTRISRAKTAPAGARTVGQKLYNRGSPDDATVAAWSSGSALADIDIPTNENWQYDTEEITLSSLGATAGELTAFQLNRVAPGAGTNLEGHWFLRFFSVEYL